jgi:hypothetical protein
MIENIVSRAFGWPVINDNHENANMQTKYCSHRSLDIRLSEIREEKKFENVKTGIDRVRFPDSILTNLFFLSKLWALRTRWDHRQASRLKQMALKSEKNKNA